MKKLLFMLFVTAIVFAVGCQKEENDLTVQAPSTTEELYKGSLIPINIDVNKKDGALVFNSTEDFMNALNLLDTVSLNSRIAWEQEIGFKSLRRIREEAILDSYFETSSNPQSLYNKFIDYNTSIPVLKDFPTHVSSLLNEDGMFYIKDAVGSFRRDGNYWALDGSQEKLAQVIMTKESDPKNGLYALLNIPANSVNTRTCTYNSFIAVIPDDCAINGNKRACGVFEFFRYKFPDAVTGLADVRVNARMEGRSHKRNCGSCNWKPDRSDHTFEWDFEVTGATPSDPHTFVSGTTSAIDNQYAAIDIWNIIDIDDGPISLLQSNNFLLEQVTSGTTHTTVEASPDINSFECN